MRLPKNPIFDTALLLADIREHRTFLHHRLQRSRAIAEQTGMPVSTVQLHLRPSCNVKMVTADHAMRWMLWLGRYDIREYETNIGNREDLL